MMKSKKNSMKIMHLSNIAGKLGGGVSQVVHALLKNQNLMNTNTHLWFFGSAKISSEVAKETQVDQKKINPLGKNIFRFPFFYNKMKKLKYNLIHQHGIFLPLSLFSIFKRKHTKVVISPHGYMEPEKLKVSQLKKNIVLWLYENNNLKNADCLIACSKKEAQSLRDFGFNQPIALLPNGVNKDFIETRINYKRVSAFREKYNILEDNKVLLFLSRIHPFKGLDLFLKSVNENKQKFRINKWIFVVAGTNENNHEEFLKEYVDKNNIDDIVRFIGPQYEQDKIDAFDSSNCFILPSKGENFGIAVIEALSRGVPVITTKTTPWQELNNNECGWWIDRSKDSFNQIITNLMHSDKDFLRTMGEKGRSLVEKKYTWPEISKQSINIYKWVISNFDDDHKNGFILYEDR